METKLETRKSIQLFTQSPLTISETIKKPIYIYRLINIRE